jgi:class 3 adenylate cyclase
MPSVRRLTAILAADVAEVFSAMGADEEGTHERLKAHLEQLVEPKIGEHRGRTVKNTGDSFLAEFRYREILQDAHCERHQTARNPRNAHIRLVPTTKAAIGGPNSQ